MANFKTKKRYRILFFIEKGSRNMKYHSGDNNLALKKMLIYLESRFPDHSKFMIFDSAGDFLKSAQNSSDV